MNVIPKIKSFLKSAKKPLIVILGPTASGKTALSLKIAHKFNGEIISTDSRQIYKGMEISTDIVKPEDQKEIPHHFLGITTPDKVLTMSEYAKLALDEIKKIYKRKHIPMLVGGTGLYISAITQAYKVPKVPPNLKLRNRLEKEAKLKGNEFVHKKLKKLDPKAAAAIHPNNLRYVIRAIEINLATGKNKPNLKNKPEFDTLFIGINWPREKLYGRINLRVDNQIKKGLVEEVKVLLKKKYKKNLPAMTSLGVKEMIPYIKGKSPLENCIETLKMNTRRYAKRQMTWFKRYDNVAWILPEELEKLL
ncbi:tRNA (adenosine(37)-N6)-dimethylallyltransferase MiaA [Candidatus Peregrinibacteria bacterium RIFCSPLOWO2_01_FULL_39_12]|nr:MAG: tRNA (adenosine(37)-N6)-dimethylallyltransferase MiaA [Candidatus Peregrinibacteria bacterium RIFCSPLOWO2_01_FULL_39_12]